MCTGRSEGVVVGPRRLLLWLSFLLFCAQGCDFYVEYTVRVCEGGLPSAQVVSAQAPAPGQGRLLSDVAVQLWYGEYAEDDRRNPHPYDVRTDADGTVDGIAFFVDPILEQPIVHFTAEKEGYTPVSGSHIPDFGLVGLFRRQTYAILVHMSRLADGSLQSDGSRPSEPVECMSTPAATASE